MDFCEDEYDGDELPPAGVPISISEEILGQLTVPMLKAELMSREVYFASKLRKADLLQLLKTSLHLPVVANSTIAPKKKKKDGDSDEETPLPWNEAHPARQLLLTELQEGRIPLDSDEMGPAEVYCYYHDTAEFQIKGMGYGSTFCRRLAALRKKMNEDTDRASDDVQALKNALANYPPFPLNHRGQPHWNGSVAQSLLEYDMSQGKHKQMKPKELWLTRIEYQSATSPDQFRWKIQQETRTQKYLYTLKYRAEEKLRSHLAKGGIPIDLCGEDEEEESSMDEE